MDQPPPPKGLRQALPLGTLSSPPNLNLLNKTPLPAGPRTSSRPLKLGICLGDPTGVGPEITLKALQKVWKEDDTQYVLVGPLSPLRAWSQRLDLPFPLPIIHAPLLSFYTLRFTPYSSAAKAINCSKSANPYLCGMRASSASRPR